MRATAAESRGVGTSQERVARIQHARIVAATLEVCHERGAANVTVADMVSRAGVSRRTFYELFDDREDCLLAALDDAIGRARVRAIGAYEARARWRERIRDALAALLRFFDEEPATARLLIVDSLAAGPRALEHRARVLGPVIAAVDEGRGEGRAREDPGPLTAEGIVGAVLSVIHTRVLDEGHPPLTGLLGPLMGMIVLPYLGAAASRKELERPAIVPASAPRQTRNPLGELNMRLTYRTMRVLGAIEALGGRGSYPSNRAVGFAAGIEDQGQISKLLARLQRIGLIENTGAAAKGSPNAWTLTRRGREFQAAVEPHSALGAAPMAPWAPPTPTPRRRPRGR